MDTNWKQLAIDLKGTFIEGPYGRDGMEVITDGWKIMYDNYTVYTQTGTSTVSTDFTRIRASYAARDDFKFVIYRNGLFSTIAKFFGAQDVTVGYPEFDEAFIIKGNDESKVCSLFRNTKIRELMLSQDAIRLEVMEHESMWDEKLPDGVFQLYYISEEIMMDLEQLKTLHRLYIEILNQLAKIGSAKPIAQTEKPKA
jgi:hypothetical protein